MSWRLDMGWRRVCKGGRSVAVVVCCIRWTETSRDGVSAKPRPISNCTRSWVWCVACCRHHSSPKSGLCLPTWKRYCHDQYLTKKMGLPLVLTESKRLHAMQRPEDGRRLTRIATDSVSRDMFLPGIRIQFLIPPRDISVPSLSTRGLSICPCKMEGGFCFA